MPGLLEALLGEDTETVEQVRTQTGVDRRRAEQAYGAAVGTILRGIEKKSKTKEGAESIWEMLRRAVDEGNVPAQAPSGERSQGGVQVREMDPKAVKDMFKTIFGKDAPDVEGAYGKVITLDPETTKKVFAQVLPAVLGGIFGEAERAPEASPQALPKIVSGARTEMERRQPKASQVFDAILDRDHDGDVDLDDLAGLFARKPR
jgi:hypothetical protein